MSGKDLPYNRPTSPQSSLSQPIADSLSTDGGIVCSWCDSGNCWAILYLSRRCDIWMYRSCAGGTLQAWDVGGERSMLWGQGITGQGSGGAPSSSKHLLYGRSPHGPLRPPEGRIKHRVLRAKLETGCITSPQGKYSLSPMYHYVFERARAFKTCWGIPDVYSTGDTGGSGRKKGIRHHIANGARTRSGGSLLILRAARRRLAIRGFQLTGSTRPLPFFLGENDFVEEAQCFSGDGETTETIPVLDASMSSLDIQDDIDEDVFNDIRNSVIDWAVYEDPENISPSEEEETIEDSFSDDSDDEDYMPPLCIRNSGVVTTGIHLEDLEAIGMDETVHDCPDNEPPEPTTLFEKVQIVEEGDIVGEPAAITYLICLKRLAEYLLLPIPLCTAKDPLTSVECRAPGPFRIDCKVRGTAVILQWVCPNEHCVWQWNSQPTFKFGMQAGDFMLATNILLSGNNFAKISLLFQFMNMKIVDRATFFRVQDAYCVDTIREFWHDCRSTIISGLKSKDSVVALADGRMDSPGFCAQFCTYTVMENDTKQIISVVNIDKRETKRISVNMEKEGFIRSFDKLRQEVKLTEICTDAHIQISALFSKSIYVPLLIDFTKRKFEFLFSGIAIAPTL
nr:uncharacterized protein LOC129413459 [Misgurnus anguillicaudatus]